MIREVCMHYVFLCLAIAFVIPALWLGLKARSKKGEDALAFYASSCWFWSLEKAVLALWFFYWMITA